MVEGILVIIDGLGDLPCRQLNNKTPLEAAETPNLDYLAIRGKLGELYPVKKGFTPGTEDGVISIFGQDWRGYPRGWLEALGAGLELKKGDLTLRANFATIDNLKNKKIIDRRAGRTLTTKEARILGDSINKNVRLPCKFIFKNTLQHRGVLVLKGGFSDNISNIDPAHYAKTKLEQGKLRFSVPEDDDELAKYSSNIVNNFIEQSFNILNKHSVNEKRRKKGFLPANIILTRSPGITANKITKFKSWACATSVPLMKGICKSLGINLFGFDAVKVKNYKVYDNLKKNLKLEIKKSIKLIKKKRKEFNYFLVYLKETDAAGHDNKPLEKKEMIEFIDKKLISFLRKFAEKKKIKIIVTADHSTPCKLSLHSSDPVPILFCDWKENKEKEFSEKEAKKGGLGKIKDGDVLKLL